VTAAPFFAYRAVEEFSFERNLPVSGRRRAFFPAYGLRFFLRERKASSGGVSRRGPSLSFAGGGTAHFSSSVSITEFPL